jgi:hypothetical protein
VRRVKKGLSLTTVFANDMNMISTSFAECVLIQVEGVMTTGKQVGLKTIGDMGRFAGKELERISAVGFLHAAARRTELINCVAGYAR